MSIWNKYRVRHKVCGGEIVSRTCSKCKQHWSLLEHWTTMDYYSVKAEALRQKGKSDKPLTGNPVTDALPAWPRWARISSTVGLFTIIGVLILYAIF